MPITGPELIKIVDKMLHDFKECDHVLGGLEFYGVSDEFLDLLGTCREFASTKPLERGAVGKVCIFVAKSHGKSSLAKAIYNEALSHGMVAYRLDGAEGVTQERLNRIRSEAASLVILDNVPASVQSRQTLFSRFSGLQGSALLLANSEYSSDAGLSGVPLQIKMRHVDQRLEDKLAWLIGLVREELRHEEGVIPTTLLKALESISPDLLATLCSQPFGARVAKLKLLATEIANAIRVQIGPEDQGTLPDRELIAIFMRFYADERPSTPGGFRLWVEGESDVRILKRTAGLARELHGVDLEEGLAILPLGEGREGGTSKAGEIVLTYRTRKNNDVFLFDCDADGRHAQKELTVMKQEAAVLEPELSCSRHRGDAEIEDFISVECLDRFYEDHPELRPEEEIIRFKEPLSRRIVVNGKDKETLVRWLDSEATFDDLENVAYVLCDIRGRFGLRMLVPSREMQKWKEKLRSEVCVEKQLGRRPRHWSKA